MALTLGTALAEPRPWWIVVVLAVVVAMAAAVRYALRRRPTGAELEKKRRTLVNAGGRIIAGEVTDIVNTDMLLYHYDVHGVHYTSTQETAELGDYLPADHWQLLGPVSVKYDPRNPANSIVICEQWSGVTRKRTTQ